jgi:parallel beta-helix repeat protein
MKKIILASIFFILSLSSVYAECVVPTDGMIINQDTTFCYGVYDLPGNLTGQPAIRISTGDITLDCNDATLNGGINGMGIVMMGGYSNVIIKNCNLNGYRIGISCGGYPYGSNTTFSNNNISHSFTGFFISGVQNFTISYNNIWNTEIGMYLQGVNNFNVLNNVISNGTTASPYGEAEGIHLEAGSSYNLIKNNDIIRVYRGLSFETGQAGKKNQYNIVEGNNFQYSGRAGIYIWNDGSLYNTIRNNNFMYNWYGIFIITGSDNLIYHNNFIGGIYLGISPISNWDMGYSSGGNYWANYDEQKEGCYDLNFDGMCDSPYVINSNNQDNYPFTHKNGWDFDGDSVPDYEDKCPSTVGQQLVYGCSCRQILDLKPSENTATNREGCSKGIVEVFTKGIGWAKDLFG